VTASPNPHWIEANKALLTAEFGALHAHLAALLQEDAPEPTDPDVLRARMPAPAAIDALAAACGLDAFARLLVLLCAGVELDGRIARQVASLNDGGSPMPTIATAFRALPGAHWSAFAPDAPLRRFRLLDLVGDGPFTGRLLRIDEYILHRLVGMPAADGRLADLLHPLAAVSPLPEGQERLAGRVAALWAAGIPALLSGRDLETLSEIAAGAAAQRALRLWRVEAADLPQAATARDDFARLWQREACLAPAALVISVEHADEAALRAAIWLLTRSGAPCVMLARHAPASLPATVPRIDVPPLPVADRIAHWRRALGPGGRGEHAGIAAVATQFDLPAPAIRSAAAAVRAEGSRAGFARTLWRIAREHTRPRLEDLAERIDTRAGWDDIVLPAPQTALLHDVAAQVKSSHRVYDAWGFRDRLSSRGLGITALFAGPSGVGKTLAAEVVANAVGLDLYRIDLSAVVSKYIGETEKNLRRIFDAAEAGGAVLLFDEADALFGRRSEVKDSHDRYANIEISYLLQRMESYAGLAVLTTNLKGHLDPAFQRRIRFVVDFPFPGPAEREAIWRRVFPDAVPRQGLDPARLAQLNVPGGVIRNIALNAAFLAAADGGVVCPAHVMRAARAEYAKLEKPLTGGELRGWEVAA
jgi:hypothetical protein